MNESSVSLTLKNVPAHLHRLLKKQAREHKRSLNQEAILCLERTLNGAGETATSLLEPLAPVSAGALLTPWESRTDMLDGFLDRESSS
jgi:plasmid stability protein